MSTFVVGMQCTAEALLAVAGLVSKAPLGTLFVLCVGGGADVAADCAAVTEFMDALTGQSDRFCVVEGAPPLPTREQARAVAENIRFWLGLATAYYALHAPLEVHRCLYGHLFNTTRAVAAVPQWESAFEAERFCSMFRAVDFKPVWVCLGAPLSLPYDAQRAHSRHVRELTADSRVGLGLLAAAVAPMPAVRSAVVEAEGGALLVRPSPQGLLHAYSPDAAPARLLQLLQDFSAL